MSGDEALLIAARLAKSGYGTVEQIMESDVRAVMAMVHYEAFVSDYEEEFLHLNKENP